MHHCSETSLIFCSALELEWSKILYIVVISVQADSYTGCIWFFFLLSIFFFFFQSDSTIGSLIQSLTWNYWSVARDDIRQGFESFLRNEWILIFHQH